MTDPKAYKGTLFDRHGAHAGGIVRAWGYGTMVFGLTAGVLMTQVGIRWWVFPVGLVSGIIVGFSGWWATEGFGRAWSFLFMRGASTPYVDQYSYQQALVMKGEIDEALRSFEAVVTEQPDAVTPRIKAAELYAKERQNHRRAAELLREAQRIPTITTGEFVYVTNRLVDQLTGPLDDPGRALVELRRLIERFPDSAAADHARTALRDLKARVTQSVDDGAPPAV